MYVYVSVGVSWYFVITRMNNFTTDCMCRIVRTFEEAAVEFVLDPSFPLNDPIVVAADNMAFTALKVLNQTIHQRK